MASLINKFNKTENVKYKNAEQNKIFFNNFGAGIAPVLEFINVELKGKLTCSNSNRTKNTFGYFTALHLTYKSRFKSAGQGQGLNQRIFMIVFIFTLQKQLLQ